MYDKEAHQKAADEAIRLLRIRGRVAMGNPPVYVNVRCTEPVLDALKTFYPQIDQDKWSWLTDVTIGIGAGFSGMGEVCGGVSGEILAIGADIVSRYRETALQRFFMIKYVQKFMRDVTNKFGSVQCRDIIAPHDISGCLAPGGDEAYKAWMDSGMSNAPGKCADIMHYAIMYPLPFEDEE
ncbi:C-GCAxxG-C-C family protein [Patescibacteria group bacterium]|nr:C-GCAxxG-C-C family protein [Patescibacteria group bacterium]